jgi:hypothetical protein
VKSANKGLHGNRKEVYSMTPQERKEDIAQLEYIRLWKERREARKVYRRFAKQNMKSAWYWFRAYLKGRMPNG